MNREDDLVMDLDRALTAATDVAQGDTAFTGIAEQIRALLTEIEAIQIKRDRLLSIGQAVMDFCRQQRGS